MEIRENTERMHLHHHAASPNDDATTLGHVLVFSVGFSPREEVPEPSATLLPRSFERVRSF